MKNVSISEKLILYFVFIGIISISIIGFYSYYYAKTALLSRTFDQLISLRLEKKNRIEQFINDKFNYLNLISQTREVIEICEQLDRNDYGKSIKINDNLFRNFKSLNFSNNQFLINKTGLIYSVDSNSINLLNDSIKRNNLYIFFKKNYKQNDVAIQDINLVNQMLLFGKNVKNLDGIDIGYLIFEIPIINLNKIMFEHQVGNGLGNTGETYLVGPDSLMRSNSRFQGDAILNIKVTSKSVINALNDKTGVDIINDYRNKLCLSSYSKVNLPKLNWIILAEIDVQEAMKPIYAIRNSILFISLIIASLVFLLAIFIASKISSPIKKLQKATEQIGSGDYAIDLKVESNDEIGLLTKAFNTMSIDLLNKSKELEEEKIMRLSSLIDGQEIERKRLSRDLHDSLGQSLLAVKLKLEQAKTANEEKKQQYINETQELLRNVINEIKELTNNLTPQVLDAFGLEQGLNNLSNSIKTNFNINTNFVCHNISENLSHRVQIYLYRIVQECFNNIIKHAQAKNVSLNIYTEKNDLYLIVGDDGIGSDLKNNINNGNGLKNIIERVELLRGTCKIETSIGNGLHINIKIPLYYE